MLKFEIYKTFNVDNKESRIYILIMFINSFNVFISECQLMSLIVLVSLL